MNRISPEEYARAVADGIVLARQSTSGGCVMAQVLLSAYDGDSFQLDVAGLSKLDPKNYETALKIIRGRYEVNEEPHYLIVDGSKIFRALWSQWKRLEIVERAKRTCPVCDGCGKIYFDDDDDTMSKPCSRCSGTGRICRCK